MSLKLLLVGQALQLGQASGPSAVASVSLKLWLVGQALQLGQASGPSAVASEPKTVTGGPRPKGCS